MTLHFKFHKVVHNLNEMACLMNLLRDTEFLPPIIPEKMFWTHSSVSLFRDCKRKFFWTYLMRLRPSWTDHNLLVGTAFHNTLEDYYKNPKKPMSGICKKHFKKLKAEIMRNSTFYDQDQADKATVACNMFVGMCLGYDAQYKNDRKKFKNVQVEKNFKLDMGDYFYLGQIDMMYNTNRPRTMETKTASSITSTYIKRLEIDNQIAGYYYGARNGLKHNARFCTYNVVKKCQLRRNPSKETVEEFDNRVRLAYIEKSEQYFHREKVRVTKEKVDAFLFNMEIANQEYQDIINNYDPTQPEAWGFNDKQCTAYFKMCPYFTLCTEGLDFMSQGLYTQRATMHSELE